MTYKLKIRKPVTAHVRVHQGVVLLADYRHLPVDDDMNVTLPPHALAVDHNGDIVNVTVQADVLYTEHSQVFES